MDLPTYFVIRSLIYSFIGSGIHI